MTQPTPPTDGVPPVAGPDGGWTATPAPSWSPVWTPPAPAPAPGSAPTGQQQSRSLLLLGPVALGGVVAGAVGAVFLGAAVCVGSAGDIGREKVPSSAPRSGGRRPTAGRRRGGDSAGAYVEEDLAWASAGSPGAVEVGCGGP